MENTTTMKTVLEEKMSGYSINLDNFTAPQELTVTITLNEYRKLISDNATASSSIEKANKDKYTREMENKNLKEEVAALKSKIYEMQKALDSYKTVPNDNPAERGEFLMNLYQITQSTQQLLEMLSEGEIPEDVYKDTVDSLGAENAIDDVVKAIRNKQAEAEAFKAEADKLTEKKQAAEKAVDSMKKLILDYMRATDQKKTETGLFTVSRRSSKSCELTDETKIPEQYLIPQPAKIDKKTIFAELKEGKKIAGARLKESESIMIK